MLMERKQKMGEEVGLGGRGEASASARSEELEKKSACESTENVQN